MSLHTKWNVVKQVCNNMAILSKGKMEAIGKVEDIFFDNPPVLEELLGSSRLENYPSQGINIEIVARNDASRDHHISRTCHCNKG